MARIQGAYYSIDAARIENLSKATGIPEDRLRNVCVDTDWPEGEEHQTWLDTADMMEIGDWALTVAGSAAQESDED